MTYTIRDLSVTYGDVVSAQEYARTQSPLALMRLLTRWLEPQADEAAVLALPVETVVLLARQIFVRVNERTQEAMTLLATETQGKH